MDSAMFEGGQQLRPPTNSEPSIEILDPTYAQFRDQTRFWIQRVAVPCLMIVGLFGNAITIIIMTRRRMRSTTNMYLAALAFVDMLYLVLTFMLGLSHYPNMAAKRYYLYWRLRPFLMMLTDACSNTSVWLTVTFTIERFIAVKYPIKGKVWCTEARAKKLIVCVFLFAILFASPVPFEWKVTEKQIGGNRQLACESTNSTVCRDTSVNGAPVSFSTVTPTKIGQGIEISRPVNNENSVSDLYPIDNSAIVDSGGNKRDPYRGKASEEVASDFKQKKGDEAIQKQVTNIKSDPSEPDDDSKYILSLENSDFGLNETYKTIYYWSTAVIFYFIPLLSLTFFNGFLIHSVNSSRRKRNMMTTGQQTLARAPSQQRHHQNQIHERSQSSNSERCKGKILLMQSPSTNLYQGNRGEIETAKQLDTGEVALLDARVTLASPLTTSSKTGSWIEGFIPDAKESDTKSQGITGIVVKNATSTQVTFRRVSEATSADGIARGAELQPNDAHLNDCSRSANNKEPFLEMDRAIATPNTSFKRIPSSMKSGDEGRVDENAIDLDQATISSASGSDSEVGGGLTRKRVDFANCDINDDLNGSGWTAHKRNCDIESELANSVNGQNYQACQNDSGEALCSSTEIGARSCISSILPSLESQQHQQPRQQQQQNENFSNPTNSTNIICQNSHSVSPDEEATGGCGLGGNVPRTRLDLTKDNKLVLSSFEVSQQSSQLAPSKSENKISITEPAIRTSGCIEPTHNGKLHQITLMLGSAHGGGRCAGMSNSSKTCLTNNTSDGNGYDSGSCTTIQQMGTTPLAPVSTQERRITIMLIAVVILFLFCQIPSAAMLVYTAVHETIPNTNEHALLLAFGNIFNFLMAVNAAGNFILYSFLSKKYRRTFVILFCGCLRQKSIDSGSGQRPAGKHRRGHQSASSSALNDEMIVQRGGPGGLIKRWTSAPFSRAKSNCAANTKQPPNQRQQQNQRQFKDPKNGGTECQAKSKRRDTLV